MKEATVDAALDRAGHLLGEVETSVEALFARSGFDFERAEVKHMLDELRLINANLRSAGQALKVRIG